MLIGLIGNAGSGKDTMADYLVKNYGFEKLSFGKILKDVVSIIFNWNRKLLEGDNLESRIFRETEDIWWSEQLKFKVTPRKILQKIGTELFRNNFNDNIWILSLIRKINDKINSKKNIIITDIRFNNEYEYLKNLNFLFVKISNNNIKNLNHSSESYINDFKYDYLIENNSSLKNYYNLIENFCKIKKLIG